MFSERKYHTNRLNTGVAHDGRPISEASFDDPRSRLTASSIVIIAVNMGIEIRDVTGTASEMEVSVLIVILYSRIYHECD